MWVAWAGKASEVLRTKNLNFLTWRVDWVSVSPTNHYVEVRTTSVMMFGAFGRYLGLDEVMKMVSEL